MKSIFKGKKIGIWGLGTVGKSVLSFISQFRAKISVTDLQKLDGFQEALLTSHGAHFVPYEFLAQFLEMNDLVIPSPGIDLKPFTKFKKKWLCELDLFAQYVKKPTIAVTGSAGKTTVVHVITHLLNKLGKRALAAGNIGFPLLDAVALQDQYDILVLELSSFQLQYQTAFSPDIALITNLHPNHLDHHTNMEEYLTAKGQLLRYQNCEQHAIIPMAFMDEFWPFLAQQKVSWLAPDFNVDRITKLSDITCVQNWQLICATLEQLGLSTDKIEDLCADLPPLKDRIECLGTKRGVTFYNDSKSTLPAATLSALQRFKKERPILFLGGLSKGVDRAPFIKLLQGKVKHVLCFGAEAEQLYRGCTTFNIRASHHATLEEVFNYCTTICQPGDIVLFSPAGSSFDLFKNYIERGKEFTKLVTR